MFDISSATRELSRRYYSSRLDDQDELMRLAKAIRHNATPLAEGSIVHQLLGPRPGWKHYSPF